MMPGVLASEVCRAGRAAPDLERACHQVTVNASGGQSNAMDRSAAVEEIEEESEEEEEEEEAEVPVPTANCAPKNVLVGLRPLAFVSNYMMASIDPSEI